MKKKKQVIINLVFIFILLILSVFNINNIFTPKKVLGIKTENKVSDTDFWQNFLAKNPNYLPGQVELGYLDKVKKIDPNFIP